MARIIILLGVELLNGHFLLVENYQHLLPSYQALGDYYPILAPNHQWFLICGGSFVPNDNTSVVLSK